MTTARRFAKYQTLALPNLCHKKQIMLGAIVFFVLGDHLFEHLIIIIKSSAMPTHRQMQTQA